MEERKLADWQQRVVDEQAELEGKLNKLQAYVTSAAFGLLADVDRTLLLQQNHAMSLYQHILEQRIARFS